MHNLIRPLNADENFLLCSLPPAEHKFLLPYLEPVTFLLGEIVYEPDSRIDYCYFPTNSVVSLIYTMQDGSTAEMGLVGNEGVTGVSVFLGGESSCSRAVVAVAGDAFRLPANRLQQEFAQPGRLQHLLLRYTQALITQVSQTAVCNRLHSVEQRLCRWLLLCHDRKKHSDLLMTQELIANMLGGRRESVTVAAGRLQDAGLIHYCRGRISILDRRGLESNVCECYRVVENEFDRLFGRKWKLQFSRTGAAFEEGGRGGLLSDQNSQAESGKRCARFPPQPPHLGLRRKTPPPEHRPV
jgi:CRP-like cAMP-binding protein